MQECLIGWERQMQTEIGKCADDDHRDDENDAHADGAKGQGFFKIVCDMKKILLNRLHDSSPPCCYA